MYRSENLPKGYGYVQTRLMIKDSLPGGYRGSEAGWDTFENTITSFLVKNDRLNNEEKLTLLKGAVVGPAREAVSNVFISEEGFEKAFMLLKEKFKPANSLLYGNFAFEFNMYK